MGEVYLAEDTVLGRKVALKFLGAAFETDPLARYSDQTPELLGHIVRKMLAKDPNDRYQSVHGVRTDLAELLRSERSAPATEAVAPRLERAFGWRLAIAAVTMLTVAGGFAWLTGRGAPATPETGEIKSLAVLPLDNLMGDPEQQYFVDGMHGAPITELSRIGALRVISRTSVNRYRDTQDSLEEIAGRLGVDAVIEGSVLRSENTVRITAQLVGIGPERHLWANNFERELEDVLGLQSDVARAIAERIRITLSPQEVGLYFSDQRGEEAVGKAREAFEQAIAIAPDYAQPHGGLAELYLWLARGAVESPSESLEKAKAYAFQALDLDDSVSDAHLTLANITLALGWNWTEAEKGARRSAHNGQERRSHRGAPEDDSARAAGALPGCRSSASTGEGLSLSIRRPPTVRSPGSTLGRWD